MAFSFGEKNTLGTVDMLTYAFILFTVHSDFSDLTRVHQQDLISLKGSKRVNDHVERLRYLFKRERERGYAMLSSPALSA
jgi:hypothetical protein